MPLQLQNVPPEEPAGAGEVGEGTAGRLLPAGRQGLPSPPWP